MIHNNDDAAMRRDVLGQLMLITKLMTADMEKSLGPAGLTTVRAQVLWEIGGRPDMTQKKLADRLGVTPRNVTALIDALEGLDFVVRKAHPSDRRAIRLALTDKGQAFYQDFVAGQDMFASMLFGDVDAASLGRLQADLRAVVSKLEAAAAAQRD